ncbi:CppA N-terminal domain-containing protein, partial [Streptococcus suis]
RKNEAIVPFLRFNIRAINHGFFEENLGLKTKLEVGPFADFGDKTIPETKLVLTESPVNRTRAVEVLNNLYKILI